MQYLIPLFCANELFLIIYVYEARSWQQFSEHAISDLWAQAG